MPESPQSDSLHISQNKIKCLTCIISTREKLENIHASVPFNLVSQKFYGLILRVTPELWQSKPFSARKDLCTPFSLYHLSGHAYLLKTPQIIQNVRPCLRLISEVTPSLFVNPIISWVTRDNQKLVYFLVNSSHLYVLSCKFISRITLSFRFNLTSHAEYIVLCRLSHLVIKNIIWGITHVWWQGLISITKIWTRKQQIKDRRLESTTSVIREMKHQMRVIPQKNI